MYILASQLVGLPVMSLQTGQAIAHITQPVVTMSSLEVMALGCDIGQRNAKGVLLMRDIRQLASDCVIVDSFDEIEDANEIVRLRNVIAEEFTPLGKLVVTVSGQRLGKVEDYTVNLKTHMLQKLYVHQSLMKSILFNDLVVDRTQIIDVTGQQFTVKDTGVKEPAITPALPQSPK